MRTQLPHAAFGISVTPYHFPKFRAAETIGRPLGSPAFLDRLEARLGRALRPGKRARRNRADVDKLDKELTYHRNS